MAMQRRDPITTLNINKRLTLRMYYQYLFSIREHFEIIHHGKKLTQQIFLDAWLKAEADQLRYSVWNKLILVYIYKNDCLKILNLFIKTDTLNRIKTR